LTERHNDADAALAAEGQNVAVGAQSGFGHSVALEDQTAEFLDQLIGYFYAQRRRTAEHDPQRAQVVVLLHGVFGQLDGNGRYDRKNCDLHFRCKNHVIYYLFTSNNVMYNIP